MMLAACYCNGSCRGDDGSRVPCGTNRSSSTWQYRGIGFLSAGSSAVEQPALPTSNGTDPASDGSSPSPHYFDNPPLNDVLCADDIRCARLDREPWSGKIFPETRLALALEVLRSIATEQIGASSAVKALAAATLEVIE